MYDHAYRNTSLTLSTNRRSRTCSHDEIDDVSRSGVDALKAHLHGSITPAAPRKHTTTKIANSTGSFEPGIFETRKRAKR
jgi:hypothetical protein